MSILSIQSHVAYGRVGNRSAVFPLERMGHEVWPVNTVQYSYHAGIPGWSGSAFGAAGISAIVTSIEGLGALGECDAVISGYLGDVETGRAILGAVAKVKRANPNALYCLDPVMGDYPSGLYVGEGLPGFMASEAVPVADIVFPNLFEAEKLSGERIRSESDAIRAIEAIRSLGPRIVVMTSYEPDSGSIGFLFGDDRAGGAVITPKLPFKAPPKGSGDLASALFIGYFLKTGDCAEAVERAASALYSVLEATLEAGGGELRIVEAQHAIADPVRRFPARCATSS